MVDPADRAGAVRRVRGPAVRAVTLNLLFLSSLMMAINRSSVAAVPLGGTLPNTIRHAAERGHEPMVECVAPFNPDDAALLDWTRSNEGDFGNDIRGRSISDDWADYLIALRAQSGGKRYFHHRIGARKA
jgi:hypothetical protein